MNRKLASDSFWSFPSLRLPDVFFGEEEMMPFSHPSGLSVSEDENKVYVEAHLPGIKTQEIEMTFEHGVLWIKAEKKEETEDKKKKFYRKAIKSFSYRLAVPGLVDESKQPEAVCKDGILKVTFMKKQKGKSKKIPVKNG